MTTKSTAASAREFIEPENVTKHMNAYAWRVALIDEKGVELKSWFSDVSINKCMSFASARVGEEFGGGVCAYAYIFCKTLDRVPDDVKHSFVPNLPGWSKGFHLKVWPLPASA